MRRLREIVDWRFLLATAFLALVVQLGFNSWSDAQHNEALLSQMKRDHATWDAERKSASAERERLMEGQRQLRRDYQVLLDYLESEGITVPPNLARTITLGSSGGSGDDDDDDRTTITVRPEDDDDGGSSPATPSPTPSQSGSTDEPDVVDDLTDTIDETRKMTEDTIRDLTDNLDDIVE